MKIDYQDRIDEYILHRMPDEERMAFENEINGNKELQEQMSFTEDVQQVLKSRNEKLTAMEEWKDDYVWEDEKVVAAFAAECRPTGSEYDYCPVPSMEQTRALPRSSGKQYLYWISGIASIFIVGFFLIHNFIGDKEDVIINPSSIEYRTMRGGGNYANIEKLLADKNYEEVIKLVEIEEEKLSEQRTSANYISDEEQRIYTLMLIREKTDELSWMKVFALLGVDRRDEALQLLDQLRKSEGEYKEKADSLYIIMYK